METTVESFRRVSVTPYYLDENGWQSQEPPYHYEQQHHIVSDISGRGYFSKIPPNAAIIMNSERRNAPERVLEEFPGCRYVVQEDDEGLSLWHRDGRRFHLTIGEGDSTKITPEMVASACYALEVNRHGIESELPRVVACGPHSLEWFAQEVYSEAQDSRTAWHRAEEEASEASQEFSRVLDEAIESGNTRADNPETIAARVAMIRATVYELGIRQAHFKKSDTPYRYSSAEEVPVEVCDTCGRVDVLEDHPPGTYKDMDDCVTPYCAGRRNKG